jgi:hypothetical protein
LIISEARRRAASLRFPKVIDEACEVELLFELQLLAFAVEKIFACYSQQFSDVNLVNHFHTRVEPKTFPLYLFYANPVAPTTPLVWRSRRKSQVFDRLLDNLAIQSLDRHDHLIALKDCRQVFLFDKASWV